MEFLGETFQLIPNESTIMIIEGAFSIYRKWIGLSLPNENHIVIPSQSFLTDEVLGIIGRHLSLLFENKNCNQKVKDKYVSICQSALHLYKWMIQSREKSYNFYIEICKLLMGIVNELISNKNGHICENLIELSCTILFDAFIISGIQERELFDTLRYFSLKWLDNNDYFNVWSSFAIGLSKGLVGLIYLLDLNEKINSHENEILITIDRKIQDAQVSYLINNAHLCYVWYKIVMILDNIFTLNNEIMYDQCSSKIVNIKRLYKTLQSILELFIELNESYIFRPKELKNNNSKTENKKSNFDSHVPSKIIPLKIEIQKISEELNIL